MTAGQRPGYVGVLIGVVVAFILAVASCSGDTERRAGADDPAAVNLERATEIAREEWGAPWILQLASSRYDLDGDGLVLVDHAYVFVSDDGAASYYLVRFHADGTISTGPVAGPAQYEPEAFEFGANALTSVAAMDIAWNQIGAALAERCGPVDWIDVTGSRGGEGRQWWRVDHSTRGEVHTVWVNAGTGALGDIVEEPC